MAFNKAILGTGPNTAGSDTSYQAHVKHNGNWDSLQTTLDSIANGSFLPLANSTSKGAVVLGTGFTTSNAGVTSVNIPVGNTTAAGLVKSGGNISIAANGVLSVATANTTVPGIVQVGTNLTQSGATISVPTANTTVPGVVSVGNNLVLTGTSLSVPIANTTVPGLIKIGTGLALDANGFVNVTANTTVPPSNTGTVAAKWDANTAVYGGGTAANFVVLDANTAKINITSVPSGVQFLRAFANNGIANTDSVYFVMQSTDGAAVDFGFGVATKDTNFQGAYLDGAGNANGASAASVRFTEGQISANPNSANYYDYDPPVQTTNWLFMIDRPRNKVYIKSANYGFNFNNAVPQNGSGSWASPAGWGNQIVYPYMGWVFPPQGGTANVKIINSASEIAAIFTDVDFTGYKPLGSSDQTGTGSATIALPERFGGLTSDYRAANVAPDLSTAQPSGGTNIALPSAYQLWMRFGVNTHFLNDDYQNGATGTYSESRIVSALNNMGFGVIRDSLPNNAAAQQAGAIFSQVSYLKLCQLTGADNFESMNTQLSRAVNYLPSNAVIYIEGSNEIDSGHFLDIFGANNWITSYNYDKQGYIDRKARTDYLKNVPTSGPTFTQYYNAYQVAGGIPWYDVGVCHPYPGGRNPEQLGFGGGFSGANGAGSYSYSYGNRLLSFWGDANLLAPGKKVICTETGYTSTSNTPLTTIGNDGNLQDGTGAASYSIRDYMYLIKLGAALVIKYELIKEPITRKGNEYEIDLGFVKNDGTMTVTSTAVSNFVKGIRETTTAAINFVPGTLSYSLGGAATTTNYLPNGAPTSGYGWSENVMSYAFQYSNGDYAVVIWRPSLRKKLPVRDINGNIVEPAEYYGAPPGVACTITINGKTVSGTPTLLDPGVSGTFGTTNISRSGNVLTIGSLSDMPLIVRFAAT